MGLVDLAGEETKVFANSDLESMNFSDRDASYEKLSSANSITYLKDAYGRKCVQVKMAKIGKNLLGNEPHVYWSIETRNF